MLRIFTLIAIVVKGPDVFLQIVDNFIEKIYLIVLCQETLGKPTHVVNINE